VASEGEKAGETGVTKTKTATMAVLLWVAGPVFGQDTTTPDFRSFDESLQSLKKEALELNRDLFLLEEELLYPANSQVAFYVSVDVGDYFDLSSVSLKIDGKEVANYLYSQREASALVRGGVHRLHTENLTPGEHELLADFIGTGLHVSDYRSGATINIKKGIGAKYVELEITDRVTRQQPEFVVREWE
jgi:hypothetical protein